MKKKFLVTALAGLSLACLFGGCSFNVTPPEEETKKPVRERVVTIADFETWETGIQLIRPSQYFGTIRLNTDTAYVKSGKQSALIHPLGGFRGGTAPIFFFPTASEMLGFDHSDFSDAEKVTFEFYNAEEEDVNVAVGLVTSVSGLNVFQRTAIEYQPLASGWNTVTYTVDVSAISINADVTDIQGIYVAFENARSREEEDAPDIYLDDVILHRYAEAVEVKDLVQLEKNEYANFEADWQKNVVSVRNTANAPELAIVNASDYKVGEAPQEGEADERATLKSMEGSKVSGDKVLRVLAKNGSQAAASYPGLQFAPVMLQRSLFGSLAEEDYGTVTFAFDIYNNSPYRQLIGVSFYNERASERYEYGIYAEPYQWYEFKVLIKDLYNDFKAKNKNSNSLFTTPGELAIYWPEFTEGDKEFFMDNFRYEITEKDETAKPEINVAPFVRVAEVGDRIELPTVRVTDKYDLALEAKLSVFEKVDGEWQSLALESGLIPVDKVGEYKLVARATNSLGNETVEELLFRGAESVEDNLWANYDYADETKNVYIEGEATATNKAEWLESVELGGENREGVIKTMTDNATQWGAGYIGFRFDKQRMDDAVDEGWDYFTISLYIEADASTVSFLSWNKTLAKDIPTGCWTEVKITKNDLNGQTYINRSTTPLSDSLFYETFYEICGSNVSQLLFIKPISTASSNSKVVYYIDKVTWGKYEETSFEDGDDYVEDIYGDEWADPWRKEEE